MVTEQAPQAGLGERPPGRRAAQDDEAFGSGDPRRALLAQVRRELGEERPVDRHDPFSAALADDPHPVAALVDVGEAQTADLACPEAAQDHRPHDRPIAVGGEVGEEGAHVGRVERLRQPPDLADEPTTTAGPARPGPR